MHKAYPNASDEDWKTFLETRRMSERIHQVGREYLEEQEQSRREEDFEKRLLKFRLEYQEEIEKSIEKARQRPFKCSDEHREDDDKTLVLGTEAQEEVFRTCSEPDTSAEEGTAPDGSQRKQDDTDMFRDGSDERPYEDREIDVEARNKGQRFFEALEKKTRGTHIRLRKKKLTPCTVCMIN